MWTRPRCLVALLFAFPVGVEAQPLRDSAKPPELKVSVASGPALPLGKAAERWAALLTEGAVERYVARLYPGATLTGRDAARELAALDEGKADLAVGSALQWSLKVPSLGVFALPWIAPRPRDLEALAQDRALNDALAARLDARGVTLVAIAPLGHRDIATTARAIRTPADVEGLRVRASPAPLIHDLLLALGALPQAMTFVEAQAALASGTLDGQEGPPTSLAAARAPATGHRYLMEWGAISDVMVFAVRKALWSSWEASEQERVRRAALQAIHETDAPAREAAARRQLGAQGMAVVRLTPAGHAAFREAAREVTARWREAVGGDIVDLAEAARAAGAAPAAQGK